MKIETVSMRFEATQEGEFCYAKIPLALAKEYGYTKENKNLRLYFYPLIVTDEYLDGVIRKAIVDVLNSQREELKRLVKRKVREVIRGRAQFGT